MTSYSKITIAGSTYLPDNIVVTKDLGNINATSTFTADIDNNNGELSEAFNIGDEVEIFTDININPPTTQIFAGIVSNIGFKGKETKEMMNIRGKDYSTRLIDRTVEPEVYTNTSAGSIVKDIVAKYTDDITTGSVFDGLNVERIVFNHTPVFDAIKELAQFTDFIFYVDNSKNLHFKEKGAISSGFTFGSGGSPILKTDYKIRRDEIFNDVWVYGDRYLDGYTETFVGNTGSNYSLSYNPHNVVVINSGTTPGLEVLQPGGIFEMTFDAGSQFKYLVNYNDKKIIFTSGTLAGDNLYIGSDIVINYMRDLPIVKRGDNDESVDLYGRKNKVIQDATIKDPLTAEAIMLTELEDLSDPLKQITLNVKDVGNINPGDTCIVNIPIYDINNITYDVLQAKYNMTKQDLFDDSVVTIKVNKKVADITDTLKDVLLQQRKLQGKDIQTTDLLTRYKINAGSIGLRTSGIEIWTREIGSSFILGHLGTNPGGVQAGGILGSVIAFGINFLGDSRAGSVLNWSGGYF